MSTIPAAGLRLQFCADPGEFLAAAGDYLARDPVIMCRSNNRLSG